MEKINNIALLIDAENIESRYIDKILSELASRGRVIVKRAYADWTKSQLKPLKKQGQDSYNLWEVLNGWYGILAAKGIVPMQQSQNTVGKNSSDIYLVIDAMDLMYQGIVDTFCIVSSDGDFTRLCTRLTEGGKHVIVMGETHTPNSVKAASEFINLGYAVEKFGSTAQKASPAPKKAAKPEEKASETPASKTAKPKNQPQNKPQEKQPEQKSAKTEHFIPMLIKKASDRDDLKPAANPLETAASTAEKAATDGKEYDEQVIADVKKIIAKHKNNDNEIGYQKLLSLLRKMHPECEKIKVGEKNIVELFKNIPGVEHRLENGNYMFSLADVPSKVSVAVAEPTVEAAAKEKHEVAPTEPTAVAETKTTEVKTDRTSTEPAEKPVKKRAKRTSKKAVAEKISEKTPSDKESDGNKAEVEAEPKPTEPAVTTEDATPKKTADEQKKTARKKRATKKETAKQTEAEPIPADVSSETAVKTTEGEDVTKVKKPTARKPRAKKSAKQTEE